MIEIRIEYGERGDRQLSVSDTDMPPSDAIFVGPAGGALEPLVPSGTTGTRVYRAPIGTAREAVIVVRKGGEESVHLIEIESDGEMRILSSPSSKLQLASKPAHYTHAESVRRAAEFFGSQTSHRKVKQRVCLVTTELPELGPPGSVGMFFRALGEMLHAAGHAVTVLYDKGAKGGHDGFEQLIAEYRTAGLELVPLSHPPGVRRLRWPERRSYAVYLWLKERAFDWIHFHDMHGNGYFTVLAKQLGLAFESATLCVGLHRPELKPNGAVKQFLQSIDQLDLSFFERRTIEGADVVVATSRFLADQVADAGWRLPQRTLLLPSPLPGSALRPEIFSRVSELSEVVFYGGLIGSSSFSLYCDALSLLRHARALPPRLTFIGPFGELQRADADELLAQKSLEWGVRPTILEPEDREEVFTYLAAGGRLAVIPDCASDGAFAVLECAARGIPMIASSAGPARELIAPADRERSFFTPTARELAERLRAAFTAPHWNAALAVEPDECARRWDALHQLRVGVEPSRREVSGSTVLAALCGDGDPAWLAASLQSVAAQSIVPVRCVHLSERDPDGGDAHELAQLVSDLPFSYHRVAASRASWGDLLLEEWNRAGAEFALVVDGLDLLTPRAVELLLEGSLRTDAAFVSGVAGTFVGDAPGEPLSLLVPLGGTLARAAFEPVLSSPVALLRRDLMSRIAPGSLGEAGLWKIAAEALLHGRNVETVPELLLHHRFDTNRASAEFWPTHRRGTDAYHTSLPDWFGSFLEGLVGTVARSEDLASAGSGYLLSDPWVAERFALSKRILFRADERTSFAGLEPLQQIVVEERGRALGFTALDIDPQFEFRWWVPRHEGRVIIRIDIYCPEATQLKLYYTAGQQQLYDEQHVAVRFLERGRNEEFITLDERQLNGFFRFDPATIAGRFALYSLEIRACS